ncbi:restriction endonuclease subunit S [Enterobacter hormaechei]|uniref:restriction endonuclease subunit S n=1 Tax=Enterobacter hormaechei TaxID=158836 RepID=UPI0007940CAC|nr:restriction endonuclease subunit S [Enterobacter hormaechei]MDH0671482.1 restriction endonuclease subunit S [Enterobacter hormaechei]MDH0716506.1 restriction endonuclease subunit S [Enterobacter hormaechei]MDY3565652.1 restriction endonuclease subunit S [Enterobacter hormaechei]SAC44797.1 restriction modification system DNA specificity domain-containing protein [Enterobacter hormaechei]
MVPKLRFKNFKKMEEKKLIDFAPLQRGYDLPVSQIESGDYPVVFSNGILKKHRQYKVKGPGVVTGRSGTIGKVTYVNKDFWPHNTSLFVTNFFNNVPKYVYYYYQHIDFSKFATGSGVPTLNRNDLHSLDILEPEIDEQTKIADFLSSVDERITLLNQQYDLLCQYKKGMMQKIFSQEVRFKDENGEEFPEWNSCQLKDVATRVTRKNKENNQTILTISGRDGLVDQMSYFNKQIASKNVTGYYLINNGEFAYNKSYSQGYPMGAIKMLTNYDRGVVSTLYICFKLNTNQSNSFYQHYFESGLQNRSIEKVAQEGARNHGLLNIGVNDFFDIELQIPSLKEQIKISDYLSALDDKIAVKKAELDKLKSWKQGLLQQMFV